MFRDKVNVDINELYKRKALAEQQLNDVLSILRSLNNNKSTSEQKEPYLAACRRFRSEIENIQADLGSKFAIKVRLEKSS